MISREWKQSSSGQTFLISTSRALLPHEFVQKAFRNPDMYWAGPVSAANMQLMLDNSCTLGLYRKSQKESSSPVEHIPIGLARMITDYVTFAYMTDVYVEEEYRKYGLGKWLIACCKEIIEEMPELRRVMLLTGSEQAQRLYKREMGMEVLGEVLGEGREGLVAMSAKPADLKAAGRDKVEALVS
ncbi:hypothetical protein K469DRAFT_263726 [Zopfia rhizophila CBS 207.26]|uniref:N-acetyltransferase domain-containing protein n=1 Tax=Zopfia rhizophila CBS 207.26 TaxID=1314779 RepID=A0A6A6DTN0_9PEZI|nr:hypothetical protein K469DRAFT_263726 [Zopfia rhizophila CBS 207.26]